jgi:hypothetical protein
MGAKGLLLTVGGMLALAAFRADAGFYFTYQRTAIATGAFAGMDRVNLIVNSTESRYSIAAVSIETFNPYWASLPNALKFRVPPVLNPDVYAPPDLADVFVNTFNPGVKGSFGGLAGGVNLATPLPGGETRAAYEAGLDSYTVIGFYLSRIDISRADAPLGIVLSSAVVPRREFPVFRGYVDDDFDPENGSTNFRLGDQIPEPAGLAGLSLVGWALVGRRRRSARLP